MVHKSCSALLELIRCGDQAESDKLVELLRGREYSPLDAPEMAWTDTGKASFARPQTTVVASGRASADLVHVDL